MIYFLFILLSSHAFAGDIDCTNEKSIYADYYADPSDCVIKVVNTNSYTPIIVYLPHSSEFIIEDDSDYAYDTCDDSSGDVICKPAGFVVRPFDTNQTVDGGQEVEMAGLYYQDTPWRWAVKFDFDNISDWAADYYIWRNP